MKINSVLVAEKHEEGAERAGRKRKISTGW